MNEYKRSRTEITIETISITTIRTRTNEPFDSSSSQRGQQFDPAEFASALPARRSSQETAIEMLRDGRIHRLADDNNEEGENK